MTHWPQCCVFLCSIGSRISNMFWRNCRRSWNVNWNMNAYKRRPLHWCRRHQQQQRQRQQEQQALVHQYQRQDLGIIVAMTQLTHPHRWAAAKRKRHRPPYRRQILAHRNRRFRNGKSPPECARVFLISKRKESPAQGPVTHSPKTPHVKLSLLTILYRYI